MRKQNIILDLDNTLIMTASYPFFLKSPDVVYSGLYIYKRPHFDEFIKYCKNRFLYICIWSAGEYNYVHNIVNKLFNKNDLFFIYTKNDCDFDEGKYYKPLGDIFNNSRLKYSFNESNTLLIDDNKKITQKNGFNSIRIPSYYGDVDDEHLLTLINFLDKDYVKNCISVVEINKNDVFSPIEKKYPLFMNMDKIITDINELLKG